MLGLTFTEIVWFAAKLFFLKAETRAASTASSTTSRGRFFSAASWVIASINSLFIVPKTS